VWGILASVLVTAGLVIALFFQHATTQAGIFRLPVYNAAVAFEICAITIAIWFLRKRGRIDLIPPVIGLIVGLHFVGLWKATDLFSFVWTALAMCVVSAYALFSPPFGTMAGERRRVIAGFGCALVLWISAAATFH